MWLLTGFGKATTGLRDGLATPNLVSMNLRLPASPASTFRVRVARAGRHYRLLATEAVRAGAVVLAIEGADVERPSRYSVQVERDVHVEAPGGLAAQGLLERHPWRFTNHSCDPNTMLSGRNLVAVRPIEAGEEITFNYNTTEYELAAPFACWCGSKGCAEFIRGFKHLTRAERERIRPLLAEHLRRGVHGPLPSGTLVRRGTSRSLRATT